MSRLPFYTLYVFSFALLLVSCKTYKSSRMFETDVEFINDSIQKILDQPDHTLKLAANDYITLSVYTAKGEKLIDPDKYLAGVSSPEKGAIATSTIQPIKYGIRTDGYASLPMVGDIYLKGYTCHQADSILTIAYSKYYTESYVQTRLLNKRVIVLGPNGGKVLAIENDNMTIIEAIALYSPARVDGKMHKIRVIRGDLKNPHVQIVNLQTIEGMRQASLALLPGDIIYIEPNRKIFTEAMQDYAPLISVFTSLVTLAVLLGVVNTN